ncbi:MAG: hypothetical protein ACRD16_01490 [Thermoanaerobaculia bacterium]
MKRLSLAAAVLLSVFSCRNREYVGPHGEEVQYSSNGKNVKVKGADGSVVVSGEGVTLPEDFPKDVPIYPGSRLASAVSASQSGNSGHMVTFLTPDVPEKVAAFYKSKFSRWNIKMEMSSGGGKVLLLQAPDEKRSLTMVANPANGVTTVTLTAQEPK